MKKNIIIAAAIIAAFVAGFKCNNKSEIINAQSKALESVNALIDKHNLYDTDGSDTMADYLEAVAKADSLYAQEQ